MVQITVQLPNEIAQRFSAVPGEIPRRILESVAAEGFRSARLSRAQVAEMLRLDARETDRFLEEHGAGRPEVANGKHSKPDVNLEAFRRLLPQLLETHAGQFVAVAEGKVVDRDPDEWALVERIARQHAHHPVLLRKVASDALDDVYIDVREFDFTQGRAA